jgi:4-hydroxybenzoate polyprenyltransferase
MNKKGLQWKVYWELARPADYLKNFFVLAPLFFAGDFFNAEKLQQGMLAFLVFCLLASGSYAINDVLDAESDRRHLLKKRRPVASGRLKPDVAITAACLWVGLGFVFSAVISLNFLMIGVTYLVLQLFYSFILKHWPICDVVAISSGFILRVIAGGLAVEVYVSIWLIICTGLLTLFLGIGKRRCELTALKDPIAHRRVFKYYTPGMLNRCLIVTGVLTLGSYVSYLFSSETVTKSYHAGLLLTLPLVAVGFYHIFMIFRQNSHLRGIVEILTQDTIIKLILTSWVCIFFIVLYL